MKAPGEQIEDQAKLHEFEEIVRSGFLRSRAMNLVNSAAGKVTIDPDDLVQDTYLKAFRNLEKFKSGTNMKAWLNTIMVRLFLNLIHPKSSGRRLVFNDPADFAHISDSRPSPEHRLLAQETRIDNPEIQSLVDGLNVDAQRILHLVGEGLGNNEIALVLDRSPLTVGTSLFRTRGKLREPLRALAEQYGYETDTI